MPAPIDQNQQKARMSDMSQDQFTRDLLQITDKNLTNFEVKDTRTVLNILCDLSYRITKCPRCGHSKVVHNGTKTVHIRIPNISEKTALLHISKQRFLCKNCGKTVIAQTPIVKPRHQISENTQHGIDRYLIEDRTMTDIAAQFNVSTLTVSRRLMALGEQTRITYDGLPESLCIDEFRSTGNHMSFIVIDAVTHEQVAILPGRRNDEIRNFFINHYSLKNRKQVKRVVMDFNAQYQSVIRELFPNVQIVADNFHLIQMVLQSLNQTRIQLMKRFKPASAEYRVLKHHWKLYLLGYDQLEKRKPQWFPHLKDWMTQESLVWRGLELDKKFENTYFVAHNLVESFKKRDYQAFLETLKSVEDVSPQLFSTIKTLIHNKNLIRNMAKCHLSNGPIEGVNRKIKQIKRTAYGFRNWKNFVYRIQIEFKIGIEKRRPIRK